MKKHGICAPDRVPRGSTSNEAGKLKSRGAFRFGGVLVMLAMRTLWLVGFGSSCHDGVLSIFSRMTAAPCPAHLRVPAAQGPAQGGGGDRGDRMARHVN